MSSFRNDQRQRDVGQELSRIFSISSENKSNEKNNDSDYTLDPSLSGYLDKRDSMGYEVYPGAERIQYDYTAERTNPYATNLIEATAHLIKGCLGTGILSIHVGFMYAGLWTSLIGTFFIGLMVSYTMRMLVKSAHEMYLKLRIPKLSYPDLAEAAVATGPWRRLRKYSKVFRYIVDVCLFVELCGSCCIYQIMIATTVKQASETVSLTVREMNLSERYYILIITAPLVLLCMIKSLKYLAPFSLVADAVVGLCLITTIYYSFTSGGNIKDRPAWKSFHGLTRFCGVCLYSIDGVAVMLPVENSMRKPNYYFIVLQYGMSTAIVFTAAIGFFGYWGWGETCVSPITRHMPAETIPLILQYLLAMMLSVTFAVHFWVPFRVVWCYIGRKHTRKHALWERFYRFVQVLLITCLSIAFPNLIRLMIFLGNFLLAYIAFVFPAAIESFVTWHEPRKGVIRWRLIKNCIIMLLGLLLSVGGVYSSLDIPLSNK